MLLQQVRPDQIRERHVGMRDTPNGDMCGVQAPHRARQSRPAHRHLRSHTGRQPRYSSRVCALKACGFAGLGCRLAAQRMSPAPPCMRAPIVS